MYEALKHFHLLTIAISALLLSVSLCIDDDGFAEVAASVSQAIPPHQ